MTAFNFEIVAITPEDERLYRRHCKPARLRQMLRHLDGISRDRQQLLDMGEVKAAEGATVELCHALLDVLDVPPVDFAAQEAKSAAVTSYLHLCDPAWLLEPMMASATMIEWDLLELTPEQQSTLRSTMPHSRIEA